MKAIILSAGQGKRLLPLTEKKPKSLLRLYDDVTILGWQLQSLAKAGVKEVVIVSGFRAPLIRQEIEKYKTVLKVRELYNPFYKLADNLGSVWVARHVMDDDFILLNGDTMFTPEVAHQLVNDKRFDITLTISRKSDYDADDMKVQVEGDKLKAVGKKLPAQIVNGESIGMMKFSGGGIRDFKNHVNQAMETPEGLKTWYLSVLDTMARKDKVGILDVASDQWCEVDFPVDYKNACANALTWEKLMNKQEDSQVESAAG